jgi:hypothetical protein
MPYTANDPRYRTVPNPKRHQPSRAAPGDGHLAAPWLRNIKDDGTPGLYLRILRTREKRWIMPSVATHSMRPEERWQLRKANLERLLSRVQQGARRAPGCSALTRSI